MFQYILPFLLAQVLADTCYLNNTNLNSPFIINRNSTLPTPGNDGNIIFLEGDSFFIICREGTTHSLISEDGDTVICMTGNKILNTRTTETLDFSMTLCKPKTPLGSVRKLNTTCANDFSLYEIGLSISETQFSPLVTVCFDESKLSPFYAETHQITSTGSTSGGLASRDAYPYFQDAGSVYGIDMDDLYYNSADVLSELGADGYNLHPLPLVRTEIFLDPLYQHLSLDYINSFPMNYSMINFQPWCPYSIAGTLGVLVVTKSDEQVELNLYNGTIPLPQWVWCVSYDEVDGKVNGFFNLTHLVTEAGQAEVSWNKICPNGTLIEDGVSGMISGKCPFSDVVDEKLLSFLASKWPQVYKNH